MGLTGSKSMKNLIIFISLVAIIGCKDDVFEPTGSGGGIPFTMPSVICLDKYINGDVYSNIYVAESFKASNIQARIQVQHLRIFTNITNPFGKLLTNLSTNWVWDSSIVIFTNTLSNKVTNYGLLPNYGVRTWMSWQQFTITSIKEY